MRTEDYIYLDENGELVPQNTPGAKVYISMEHVKVLHDAEDRAKTLYEINECLSAENEKLREIIRAQKVLLGERENGKGGTK